ncbi:MAG: class I SAM-dependent methyltransferase, partial [Pseudoxanthomonas sp.]
MSQQRFQRRVAELLEEADVRIGGEREWDLQVRDPHFYPRVLGQGSLGLGESYMDGWWEARSLDAFLFHVLRARLEQRVPSAGELWDALRARLLNMQTRSRSREVGERHYDLGNDLYAAMLGKRLVYSCAYWTQADGRVIDDLDAA